MSELPMLAMPTSGASGRRRVTIEEVAKRKWIMDVKLDGIRAFDKYGRLQNRDGVDIGFRYPEIALMGDHWRDGEIVALDGTFDTVQMRDAQSTKAKIARLAKTHPCRFVAFDLLDADTIDLTYHKRREALEILAARTGMLITPCGEGLAFAREVKALGMEGVIAKRPASRYQFGKRSGDWLKFKNLHRITMVAIGYEPGQGARQHFGSMTLALVGPEGPVTGPEDGWRVGSGFTDRETWRLKDRLDAGDLFAVEVEVLNMTKDGALRFPVYRGVRNDVAVTDCSIEQLDTIPTC